MIRTRRHWILIGGSAIVIGSGVALAQSAVVSAFDATLPDARGISRFSRPGTITLLASDGAVIQKLGPATREKIKPGEMPLLVKQAFIAAEDRRFYEHNGVDIWGIGRALVRNVRQGAVREGASTITQQLARTVFLSQDRTITRKIKEAALAYKLERQLSKEQILEQYLNYVYLGASAYGLSDAAWVYFSKTPDQLNLEEAALLAGLPPEIGLYASILPLVAYAIFGTSRALAVGPVAVVSLMTASAVGNLAAQGTAEYLGAAIALARFVDLFPQHDIAWRAVVATIAVATMRGLPPPNGGRSIAI